MIAQVRLPNEAANLELEDFKPIQKPEGQTANNNSLVIQTRILHEGEVNKAQFMPQKYNIIATKTNSGQVHIFDYSGHQVKPKGDEVKPDLRLMGHTKQGFGLSWSPKRDGHLISGADDAKIFMWDINAAKEKNGKLDPLHEVSYHQKAVNVFDV